MRELVCDWEDMMPTRSKQNQQKLREIERVTARARASADRLFDGDLAKGFLYWATDLHLDQTASSPTEEDLLGNITDGKDDLELDAYYVDDDAMTVYLFQSKYRSEPGNLLMRDLASFLDVPTKLTTPQILAEISNEKVLDFAPTFRQLLLEGYDLQLVYLTTSRTTRPIRARAEKWTTESLNLQVGGEYISVGHSASILDIDSLVRIVDSLSDMREVELTLAIDPSGYHEANSGGFRCLIATLPLAELATTFDEHRYAIFRHNPRGPLGSVAVNKGIRDTLTDRHKRSLFQLMNNGLSAVCSGFAVATPRRDGTVTQVTVKDFQIVNGCQTTYSIYDHWRRGGDFDDATVTLKLVEDSSYQLRHVISAASNRQSQMKDWDFLFDQSEQLRLQNEFKNLDPPVFYELRRGEYKYIAGSPDSDRATVKDIAQTMWAFIGSPGEAKDKLRDIPRSKDLANGAYRDVFFPRVEAERLRLPWTIHRRIQDEWKKYVTATDGRGDEREHGRLHILWLIGRSLVKLNGSNQYKAVPLAQVRQLTETMDEWFPGHHTVAVDTITHVVEVKRDVAIETGRQLSLRQLFRSPANYESFIQRHDRLIQQELTVPAEGWTAA